MKRAKRIKKSGYPSDVSDDEWAYIAPYLTLMEEDAPQRTHKMRDVFNGLRWIVRAGAPWRLMPNDLPPWEIVYQQTHRWINAGVFEDIVNDLREILRLAEGRNEMPTGSIMDSRTLQSSPESGHRAGYDGGKRRKGSKVHIAVDTLGHLLAMHVTPANEEDRVQVGLLAQHVQEVTGDSVEVAFVDQEGLCAFAKTLGCGAHIRVVCAFSQAFPRLRATATDIGGSALCGVCPGCPHQICADLKTRMR